MSPQYSAIVADELPLVCDGLSALCDSFPHWRTLAQCHNGEEAWQTMQRLTPDVALIDLNLPRMLTMELLRRTREAGLRTRVVILSPRSDRSTALESLRAGASGFVLKTVPARELEDALSEVIAGRLYISPSIILHRPPSSAHSAPDPLQSLSAREQQVFSLLVEGIRGREIASRLALSPKTVDTYRASLMRKLDIHDLAGLVRFALQRRAAV